MFKLILGYTAAAIGVLSAFIGLLSFFTGAGNLEELLSLLRGRATTTARVGISMGADPDFATLSVTAGDSGSAQVAQGCEVRINGNTVGTCPLDSFRVEPGRHRVVVTKKGYIGESAMVRVGAGESAAVSLSLFPNTPSGVKSRETALAIQAELVPGAFSSLLSLVGVCLVVAGIIMFVTYLVASEAISDCSFNWIILIQSATLSTGIAGMLFLVGSHPLMGMAMSFLKDPLLSFIFLLFFVPALTLVVGILNWKGIALFFAKLGG